MVKHYLNKQLANNKPNEQHYFKRYTLRGKRKGDREKRGREGKRRKKGRRKEVGRGREGEKKEKEPTLAFPKTLRKLSLASINPQANIWSQSHKDIIYEVRGPK